MSQAEGTPIDLGVAETRTYTVYRMPPKKARRHINKVGRILAPMFGDLIEAQQKAASEGKDPEEADIPLGRVIAEAVERVDLAYLEELMDVCAEYTVVEPGGQLDKCYDAVFLDEPQTQYRWFWHALRVQFGVFFLDLAGGSSPILEAIKGGPGPIPEHLDWMVWRLVINKVATLKEIETYYDIVDVFDANEALDLQDTADHRASQPKGGAR